MKLTDADMAARDSAVLDLVTRLGIPTSVSTAAATIATVFTPRDCTRTQSN